MIPPTSAPLSYSSTVKTASPQTASRPGSGADAGALRTGAGEAGSAKIVPETSKSVDAVGQGAHAGRMRDGERAESTFRATDPEAPTGPPPTFSETPLERAARMAFEPPEPTTKDSERAARPAPDAYGAIGGDKPPPGIPLAALDEVVSHTDAAEKQARRETLD